MARANIFVLEFSARKLSYSKPKMVNSMINVSTLVEFFIVAAFLEQRRVSLDVTEGL